MKYDYRKAIEHDIKNYIEENYTTEELKSLLLDADTFIEDLTDKLWVCDSVTGNASGSYTFSTWEAEENLCHNLDLLTEAFEEFGCNASAVLEKGAECCDVTIRCYLLGQTVYNIVTNLALDMAEV